MVREPDHAGVERQRWYSLDANGVRFATKKDAHEARIAHLGRIANPDPVYSRESLGAFLRTWHAGRPNLSASSRLTSHSVVERRILPHLGTVSLIELSPAHILTWHADLASDYKPSSINAAHVTLSAALNDAVDWDLLPRNVASRVTPPSQSASISDPWTTEQTHAFLTASDAHPSAAAFRILVSTGIRIGELLGLRWQDVQWSKRELTIARTLTRDANGHFIVGETTKSRSGLGSCSASPISRLICYVATKTGKRSFVVSPATHGVTMDSSSALDVGRG